MHPLIRRRLQGQGLSAHRFQSPEGVAARLLALQGQDHTAVCWALGCRLPGSTRAGIEQAFSEGRLARSWLMRGTLHVVAAPDLPWLLGLLAPRVQAACAGRLRALELDPATIKRSNDLIARALQEGPLDRAALLAKLQGEGLSTAGQRGIYLLMQASLAGLAAQGESGKGGALFRRLDTASPMLDRDEALARLAGRYFTGHGPATVRDLAWWAGIPLRDARLGLEEHRASLQSETWQGQAYYWAESDTADTGQIPDLLLLPGFDEYLLGYQDRRAVLAPEHAPAIAPGNNGIFMPMLVADGQVMGTWKAAKRARGVTLIPHLFRPLSGAEQAALPGAARRYADYLGLPLAGVLAP